MQESFRCELVGWQAMHGLCRRLAQRVRASGFRPEVVVAIARGGFVPSRLLCDFLDISELASMRVVHYRAGATREREARLAAPLSLDVRGKRVLLVDDLVDTGETMVVAMEHLAGKGAAEVRSAVMQAKKGALFHPDFVARRIVRWRWVIYPWAVLEDLCGLLRKQGVMPRDADELGDYFRQAHGVRLPPTLRKEVLEMLASSAQKG